MDKFTIDSVKNFETDVDYTTVLENFEGPLDLLLYLINKNDIEIKDVFVSKVTEQFLDYMKGLPYLDMEKATDYLNIASTIIDIKARSLLPPVDDGLDYIDDDFDDPKAELIRAIEEYKMIKEETPKLQEMETVGYFFKAPDKDYCNVKIKYKDFTLDGLVEAFTKLMLKREALKAGTPPPREIPKDRFTVKEKITHIRQTIKEKETFLFEDLFEDDYSTPEVVTTFQALLELLKHQFILVEQEELFSSITIKRNPDISEDAEIGQIDEYN